MTSRVHTLGVFLRTELLRVFDDGIERTRAGSTVSGLGCGWCCLLRPTSGGTGGSLAPVGLWGSHQMAKHGLHEVGIQ